MTAKSSRKGSKFALWLLEEPSFERPEGHIEGQEINTMESLGFEWVHNRSRQLIYRSPDYLACDLCRSQKDFKQKGCLSQELTSIDTPGDHRDDDMDRVADGQYWARRGCLFCQQRSVACSAKTRADQAYLSIPSHGHSSSTLALVRIRTSAHTVSTSEAGSISQGVLKVKKRHVHEEEEQVEEVDKTIPRHGQSRSNRLDSGPTKRTKRADPHRMGHGIVLDSPIVSDESSLSSNVKGEVDSPYDHNDTPISWVQPTEAIDHFPTEHQDDISDHMKPTSSSSTENIHPIINQNNLTCPDGQRSPNSENKGRDGGTSGRDMHVYVRRYPMKDLLELVRRNVYEKAIQQQDSFDPEVVEVTDSEGE